MQTDAVVYVINNNEWLLSNPNDLDIPGLKTMHFNSATSFLKEIESGTESDAKSCVLSDVLLSDMTGIELQETIMKKGINLPIVFLSAGDDLVKCVEAMRGGAADVLKKNCHKRIILESVLDALNKQGNLCADKSKKMVLQKRFDSLTKREKQIFSLLVDTEASLSSENIAEHLFISRRTVEHHRASIKEKMAARSLIELIDMARHCVV